MSSVEKLKAKVKKLDDYYVPLKPCPICGTHPVLIENNLDRGDGHGYPGCFMYWYECPSCSLLKSDAYGSDNHYPDQSQNIAKQKAAKDWNEMTDYINDLIDITRGKINE